MLIVSIPKSASTSLLDTFGKLHALPSQQLTFKHYEKSDLFPLLGKYHPDAKLLGSSELHEFALDDKLYKQHVLPTADNLSLLKNIKKVVLLRNPYDIVLAYRRAELKSIHGKKSEFEGKVTEGEWLQAAENNGLLNELKKFNNKWIKEAEKNSDVLIIHYRELTKDTHKVINKMEAFYNLPVTTKKIALSKKRYSRHSFLKQAHSNLRSNLMKLVIRYHVYERLKGWQAYLRNHGISWV